MEKVLEEIIMLEEDSQKGKFLKFSLGKESYGIGISHVTASIDIKGITDASNYLTTLMVL